MCMTDPYRKGEEMSERKAMVVWMDGGRCQIYRGDPDNDGELVCDMSIEDCEEVRTQLNAMSEGQ